MTATEPFAPGSWLTGRAWLDTDGKHVWTSHHCTEGRVVTMMPWPIWHSTGLAVEPSVACDACGFHTILQLGVPDQDYRCMDTWEVDGRWCELMKGHTQPHRNSSVNWAVYDRRAGES